jgi:hypothetical protein
MLLIQLSPVAPGQWHRSVMSDHRNKLLAPDVYEKGILLWGNTAYITLLNRMTYDCEAGHAREVIEEQFPPRVVRFNYL